MLSTFAKLKTAGQNATMTIVGRVRLFWSYDSLIAYEIDGGGGAFNPVMRGLTATTNKHARAMGCADLPDATTPEAFEAGLRAALGSL